jgi:hypothetical protein
MSIKKLNKQIMMSSVYQLSTETDKDALAKDSGDRFYWRMDRKRMDAEQVRDAVLMVSGNLDTSMGGPSAELTPGNTRRTVYGRVSRYKLDEYLQLFDFPSPNISAEKRFTTTVPLQRLFLMNSDFVSIESEELAKRVAAEADNRARIKKVYLLAYGREPSEQEIALGIDYLHAEPMREYEENKNKPPDPAAGGGGRRGGRGGGSGPATGAATATAKPPMPDGADGAAAEGGAGAGAEAADGTPPAGGAAAAAPMPMGMGMMGGMGGGRGGRGGGAATVAYDPTAWGRYIKVLLSASEFVFIN